MPITTDAIPTLRYETRGKFCCYPLNATEAETDPPVTVVVIAART
jgi:hypothetical protein